MQEVTNSLFGIGKTGLDEGVVVECSPESTGPGRPKSCRFPVRVLCNSGVIGWSGAQTLTWRI